MQNECWKWSWSVVVSVSVALANSEIENIIYLQYNFRSSQREIFVASQYLMVHVFIQISNDGRWWRWCMPFFRKLFYTHESTCKPNSFLSLPLFFSFFQYVNHKYWKLHRKVIKRRHKRPNFQSQTSKSNFTNRFWCGLRTNRIHFRWVNFYLFRIWWDRRFVREFVSVSDVCNSAWNTISIRN